MFCKNVLFLSIERVELPVWHKRAVPQRGVLVFALAAPIQIAFCGKSFYSRVRSVDQKQSAPLAQRIAQLPSKQWVVGSNPTGGTSVADDLSFQEEGSFWHDRANHNRCLVRLRLTLVLSCRLQFGAAYPVPPSNSAAAGGPLAFL